MEIFGDKLFAKDADGKLLSRIGTMFFRTPGLVTKKGVHAMQERGQQHWEVPDR